MTAEEYWPIWMSQRFPTYQEQAAAFMKELGWREVAWEFAEAYASIQEQEKRRA